MVKYIKAVEMDDKDTDLFGQPCSAMDNKLGRRSRHHYKNYMEVPRQPGIEDVIKADEVVATHTIHEWAKFEETIGQRKIGHHVDLYGRQGTYVI